MVMENNKVTVRGNLVSDFCFDHEVYGERFYTAKLLASRLSEQADVIPLMISERLLDVDKNYDGCAVEVIGQFRSYDRYDGEKKRLILRVFVKEINCLGEFSNCANTNQIFLDGYICKEPVYRETPLSREIADILLAVNRPYGKSDYIPCIAWGRNARYTGDMEIGTNLKITGRIQSREYQKQISDGEYETRTAYEVSISNMEVVESEKCKDQVADAE